MDNGIFSKAQIPSVLDSETMLLPGNLGYGMAILDPSRVVPYLHATFGKPITSINEVYVYGVRTVIDLNPDTRRLHAETSQNMQYRQLPIEGIFPDQARIAELRKLILDSNNLPLVMIASSPEILAGTWAAYRRTFGVPVSYVVAETVPMGLLPEQESILQEPSPH